MKEKFESVLAIAAFICLVLGAIASLLSEKYVNASYQATMLGLLLVIAHLAIGNKKLRRQIAARN